VIVSGNGIMKEHQNTYEYTECTTTK
jgi:hypothetical protein